MRIEAVEKKKTEMSGREKKLRPPLQEEASHLRISTADTLSDTLYNQYCISSSGQAVAKSHHNSEGMSDEIHKKLSKMPKGNREVYSHLIQEVQSRECLYVPTHPQYKDRQKLETEWAEIGRILGVSGYVAKKTWQNLRSSYTRCLASEKSSNLMGSGRKSTWYLKDQMEFLREYMSTMAAFDMGRGSNCFDDLGRDHSGFDDMNRDHNSLDDMGPTTEELVNSYIKEEAREQEESTNDSASSSYFSTPVLPTAMKRQKMSYPHEMSDSPSTTTATETLWKIMSSEGDDDLVFFKGLLPTVRQLSDQNNRKFKHSISNYLFELLEAQESPSEPSPKPLQIE
ncbi:hypothetical protein Btru_045660 [Bulinus truncatus]|nr:hypothetical protein Btru_045660 [Bulinus truncatus]